MLLYDPQLQPLKIETNPVNGNLRNNKRDITYFIHNSSEPSVNITSGPLSYTYRLYQIKLHYGVNNSLGSEHTIDGKSFVGEVQFLADNAELYSNHTVAQLSPRGIAVIAVFLNVGETENLAFDMFRKKFYDIQLPDTCTELNGLPIDKLLPRTLHYMTYSGSLTQPGCKETVTWVILNKPIYISSQKLFDLRQTPYQEWRDSNARPVMPLNQRTVRTNINIKKRSKLCNMEVAKKYEGVTRWGKDGNDDWRICQSGKNQSPINIQPQMLLYDPQLQPLKIETNPVNGNLRNNKRDITYFIHNSSEPSVNITSGPLSYTYRLYQIKLHYGVNNSLGSEHTIDGKSFVGEVQFLAYNAELYSNHTEAQLSPRGIAVIAVFLNVGETENLAFDMFRKKFYDIKLPDTCTELNGLPIDKLLPRTLHYMTYSGSLTQPGCKETVTWVILNKPIYISSQQLFDLRQTPYQEWRDSNARPVMPLNHRTVRTNINIKKRSKLCNMEVAKKYEGVTRWGKDGNDDWRICQSGKNQSPINIQPQMLLYDPQLQPLKIETNPVNGNLRNNKRDITYFIHNSSEPSVNITSGPLSYTYRLYQIKLHYGVNNSLGSEHTIDGKSFVGEVQFLAYNAELYSNHTEAQLSPRGIAVIAVFLNVGETENLAFDMFRKKFYDIKLPDTCTELNGLPIDKLLPRTLHYMTYSGSLTQPGCKETVTWVILNKLIYISSQQLFDLRQTPYQEWRDSNARPVMPLNHRTVRTNINIKKRSKLCNMEVAK